MIFYVLNLVLFSATFWVVYQLLLKKETFFTANRVYLLIVPVLVAILPFLVFDAFNFTSSETTILEIPLNWLIVSNPHVAKTQETGISLTQILWGIYVIGAFISLGFFLLKIFKLEKLKKTGKTTFVGDQKIISVPKNGMAFTFFNTIFLGENYSETEKRQIIEHELVHIQQKHSWDLVYFEALRILMWFNPFVYVFQKNIAEVHEFTADKKASALQSKKAYAYSLLNANFGAHQLSFTNPYFTKNSLKTRIVMLHKKSSNRFSSLKFLVVVPLVFLMLTYVACSDNENTSDSKQNSSIQTKGAKTYFVLMDNPKGGDTIVYRNMPVRAEQINGKNKLIDIIPQNIWDTLSKKKKKEFNKNIMDLLVKKGTMTYTNNEGKKMNVEIKGWKNEKEVLQKE